MIQHITDTKGGLHNRITRHIRLMPFFLSEILEYLEKKGIKNLDHLQVQQLYMALGGIPYYWSFVQKGRSAAQTIDELLFENGAPLSEEYGNLQNIYYRYREVIDEEETEPQDQFSPRPGP